MERKNAWKGYDEAKSAKVDALAKDYMDFLDILAHVLPEVAVGCCAFDGYVAFMDGMEDYYLVEGGIITVNTETAAILGIDYSVFSSMANTVVEVKTGE